MTFNTHRAGRKIATVAKKASVGGGKATVMGSKVGVGVGKAMNLYSLGSGDKVIAAARTTRTGGRIARQTGRGKTAGNRKKVDRFGTQVSVLQR